MAQECLDDIHRLAQILGDCRNSSMTNIKRNAVVGLLKELQSASDLLFTSRGNDSKNVIEILNGVSNMITKLKLVSNTAFSPANIKDRKKKKSRRKCFICKIRIRE